jgi:hypothetical protein
MQSDMIRNLTSSGFAVVVVVGGMIQLYFLINAGVVSGEAGLAILGPLMGAAAAWAFNRDANTAGARAAERAVELGANAANAERGQVVSR